MCRIQGNFSPAMKRFYFVGPSSCNKPNTVEIIVAKPKSLREITSDHLQDQDRKWLIIESPEVWVINLRGIKDRFAPESEAWLPDTDALIEIAPEVDSDGWIRIALESRAINLRHPGD